ncbi:DUF4145 domain-containing protein [Rossellomorea marisflavi]|uniref:DUF4145 domain-containing protein n=1 Tax=Rossellomorea marisflavi TaxID=189381 RepID=UPI003D2AED7B
MELIHNYEYKIEEDIGQGYQEYIATFVEYFEFYKCPVCINVQLLNYERNSEDFSYEDEDIHDSAKVLFPQMDIVRLNLLPKNIRNTYESALKVRNLDYALCVMALRRTLEGILKDKGAVSGPLHRKINQLVQQGVLSPVLKSLTSAVKDFGNMAAHADEVKFEKYMVDKMFTLINTLLEYIYIVPSDIKSINTDMLLMTDEFPFSPVGDENSNEDSDEICDKQESELNIEAKVAKEHEPSS